MTPADPDLATAPLVGRIEQWLPCDQPPHVHRRHQILCAAAGVVHVTTSLGTWVLPATRAIWISARTEHSTRVKRPTDTRVLYIDASTYAVPTGAYCLVMEVTPLVRELIAACAAAPWDYGSDTREARLAQVLIDQVQLRDHSAVDLPLPADPRALRVAQLLQADPANRQPLAALASRAGSSARTIERLFKKEAGLSFGHWRHRQRLLSAMEHLAYGDSVMNAALATGYESASSFVAAFKSMFGTTPARYFKSG